MNNDKFKRVYKSIMLIIVVAIITFVLTSVFLYDKLGTSSKYTSISGVNSELLKINFKLLQPLKAQTPMLSTLEGITIVVKASHSYAA